MKKARKIFALVLALVFVASSFSFAAFGVEYTIGGTKGKTDVSESYKSSKYFTYFSDVTLTGDNATDVLAIALSQLGYTESDSEDSLGGFDCGKGNFTEYNKNFGDYGSGYGYHWCASFVSFCLLQANVHELNTMHDWCRDHSGNKEYIWRELGCEKWRVALEGFGLFKTSAYYAEDERLNFSDSYDPEYIPSSGDLIFFTENAYRRATHIGLVLYVEDGKVYTVEGNTTPQGGLERDGDGVYAKSYDLGDFYIIGYGDMPYKTNDGTRKIDYSGKSPTQGLYMSKSDVPVYISTDALTSDRQTGVLHTVKSYNMFYVKDVLDGGILNVECTVGNEILNGYVKAEDAYIQLSAGEATLSMPPKDAAPQKNGCKSALGTNLLIYLVPIAAATFIFKKKKAFKKG